MCIYIVCLYIHVCIYINKHIYIYIKNLFIYIHRERDTEIRVTSRCVLVWCDTDEHDVFLLRHMWLCCSLWSAKDQAAVGYCYGESTSGQRAVYALGMTGIPIYNVNNNCATGSRATEPSGIGLYIIV